MLMGCYGIGVSRELSAAAIEQNHDDERDHLARTDSSPFQVNLLVVLNPEEIVTSVTCGSRDTLLRGSCGVPASRS